MTFTTGANITHYNQGFRGHFHQVLGLTDEWAQQVDPTLIDTSAARERLRRFRALFVHTVSGDLPTMQELPTPGRLK